MNIRDRALLLFTGVAFWILGTLWYRLRGHEIFETTPVRFWINFLATPLATAALCVLVLRWRHIPTPEWPSALLLVALPGMFGEALILARFATFMPTMEPASAGRYGSFLFATYALVLTVAEISSLNAQP